MEYLKKAIAECAGTFLLVFFACGTAITSGSVVATALAFGVILTILIFVIGGASGCHINPAVSLAMLISKKMTFKEFLVYIGAQFVGAILGALVLYGVLALAKVEGGYAINLIPRIWNDDSNKVALSFGTIMGSFIFELILTFVFVFVILSSTSSNKLKNINPVIIGITLVLVHLIGINVTGTSVNPARSFGPALMSLIFMGENKEVVHGIADVWLFIVAPCAGGALAALVYKGVQKLFKAPSE